MWGVGCAWVVRGLFDILRCVAYVEDAKMRAERRRGVFLQHTVSPKQRRSNVQKAHRIISHVLPLCARTLFPCQRPSAPASLQLSGIFIYLILVESRSSLRDM